jgi:hypothetical protein
MRSCFQIVTSRDTFGRRADFTGSLRHPAICTTSERERDWLLRALSTIAQAAGLQELVPKTVAVPAAYIVGTQYDRIRVRLFHAKPSSGHKTLDVPDPEEVASAYERLIRIWRQIAERCLSMRGGGGGAKPTLASR